MELTKIQRTAVEEIYSYYSNDERRKVDFKAPTGSGKTFMATWLISSIIERNPQENYIFVVATPSSSNLPLFFEQKINIYKKDLPYSKFQVEYIESPSSKKNSYFEETPRINVEKNKVYIFGKSTFGAKRIFTELHTIDDFIENALNMGYKIIYIRDEAHIGDISRTDDETRRFETLMSSSSHFILKMTATPNFSDPSTNIVIIKETDLNDITKNEEKWLLKTKPTMLLQSSMSEDELLDNAILKFIDIKKLYKTLEKENVYINPALLLQVSNEPSNKDKKTEFNNYLDTIKKKLNYYGLSWVQYFGNNDKDSNKVFKDNFTLDSITKSDSDIDVVLFKVGPSTGWDIPRACMLLQLRKVCSDKLNIQTIGRIKRNSFPGLIKNNVTDKYYIYSNSPQVSDDLKYFSYKTKEQHKDENFASIEIVNKNDFKITAKKSQIQDDIVNYIRLNKQYILQDIKNIFVEINNVDCFKEELYSTNNGSVYRTIQSPFIFLKTLRRLIESKNQIFNLIKDSIEEGYKLYFANETIYGLINVKIEHLQYILLHKYLSKINEIIKKNSPFNCNYNLLVTNFIPESFIEVYDNIQAKGIIENTDNSYLFDIHLNNKDSNIQPLDSTPEQFVFNYLKQEIYGINYLGEKVKIWCKNYAASSVSSDYLDDNHKFHKSYFDFIIKFSNGIYLYIEVKNKNDINAEKTELLKKSYDDYFNGNMTNMFNIPIVISLWTVDESNVYCDTYYDEKIINHDLKTKTYRELLKTIALINTGK